MSKSPATTTKDIREWAIGEGREVSPRGRISAEIEQAFHDAQATKAQAKAAPVKKTAMKKAPAKKTPVEKVVEKEAPVEGAAAGTAPAKKTAKEIREWAIGEGREVSLRGRISAAIVRFFHDAAAKLPAVGG
ncbi:MULTISPECIES: histone-like nucleoid-structuring protein Lsr2 [unclassified Rhodococcus (in: high G+C Gram-positive bacteria)]|uniref:Lsr2 family DNA-binding protein n=2 Tax=Rhodococcus TaxID=1827 RepID=UPI00055D324C|nr:MULTISPECIES: histone-like nucleoid-structuring protein Lsr2 [Rhodococcus]